MKAITLHQPWASLIAVRAKTIETRSWRTHYRGPLAIHAGKIVATHEAAIWRAAPSHCYVEPIPSGAVVASATLIDCVPIIDATARAESMPYLRVHAVGRLTLRRANDETPETFDREHPFSDFSPGRFAWLLGGVSATTERCPWCWPGVLEPGIVTCLAHGDDRDEACFACWNGDVCPVCEGRGSCAPIPARGKQGLWDWLP